TKSRTGTTANLRGITVKTASAADFAQPSSVAKGYYVVLGGFTQKSGADLVANKAKSLGLDGKVIALKNGNYRVAAYGANETDARNAYDI
ncbi:MAG TPA: hypothetical protein PKD56_11235, partial [Chitinophagales bacterium]|nr:hypothetical protein [Chitinophagales bacterium]